MDERKRAANVVKVLTGDADALQRLIVHYHATLRGAVGVAMDADLRTRIDPDDVLQEAYVAAFKLTVRRTASSIR